MRAFILCAGLGTRLRPLTNILPKAMLPVCGRANIFHILNHLKTVGIKEIIINIHSLPQKLRMALGKRVNYSYEPELLNTGGGLKKVEYFLKNKTFIMYNCDVITNVNLKEMLSFHRKNKNCVTLLASKTHNPKRLFVGKDGKVIRIGRSGNYTFCGIHIIEPFIFSYIPKDKPISIIDVYKKLIKEGIPIKIFPLGRAFWHEIGSMKSYEEINESTARCI